MKTLYVDMDGTLAKWNEKATPQEVASNGYFRNRELQNNLLDALNMLSNDGYAIYILSSAYQDGHSEDDKKWWLKHHNISFPAIFVPYGDCKKDYVKKEGTNFLLDDFSHNLREWETDINFVSIKFRNEINGRKGTWRGADVSHNLSSKDIADKLKEVINAI